jgi:hypothetical protein
MQRRFALVLSLLWLACGAARADVVVLACGEECSPAQFEGLELELRGHGGVLTSRPAPAGFTPTSRAADAQRVNGLLGAGVTLWIEHEAPLRVRAYASRTGSIHEAPLPAQLSGLEPRVFAAVVGSVALEALSASETAASAAPLPAAVTPAPGPSAGPPTPATATQPISPRGREHWPARKSSAWSRRFFVRAGVAVGFARMNKKTRADRAPSSALVSAALSDEVQTGVTGAAHTRLEKNGFNCDFTLLEGTPPSGQASNCLVAVRSSGVAWTSAIDLAAGLNVSPVVALAATARIDPTVGMGPLANLLLGLQVEVALRQAKTTGFWVSVAMGVSAGQVQVRVPSVTKGTPYARSGLFGVRAGLMLGYRFLPRFGIVATPVVHSMFPDTLWVLETNLNLEVRI